MSYYVSDIYSGARVRTHTPMSSPVFAKEREKQIERKRKTMCEKCANLFIQLTWIVILSSYRCPTICISRITYLYNTCL